MAYVARCFDENGALTPAAGEVQWPFGPIPEAVRRDPEQVVGNALVFAAAWGQTPVVDLLLDRGAPIDLIPAGFDYSGTPLHYAAFGGRTEMVDLLLRRGANPSVKDTKIGSLPEDWAEHTGHNDLAGASRPPVKAAAAGASPARAVARSAY